MTNVAPDGTVKVLPDCTVNGPATSALSLAASVKFCVKVCTFLYTPLIVVNLSYDILESAGVPASNELPSKIPKNVSEAAGGAVKAILDLVDPKVNALLGS